MKNLIAIILLALLTGCSIQKPNALKVESSGVTYVVRYPNAEIYRTGEIILVPVPDYGTYFMEEAKVMQHVRLKHPPVDDELSQDEVVQLMNDIL